MKPNLISPPFGINKLTPLDPYALVGQTCDNCVIALKYGHWFSIWKSCLCNGLNMLSSFLPINQIWKYPAFCLLTFFIADNLIMTISMLFSVFQLCTSFQNQFLKHYPQQQMDVAHVLTALVCRKQTQQVCQFNILFCFPFWKLGWRYQ